MSVNKVFIMGNLGQDPDLRHTANSNTAVCTLRIATNERKKDQSGNWTDHTEWHSVVVFGNSAENCGKYLKKGRTVFIEGKLQTRKWQDKEGKDRYSTEVIADRIEFVGGGRTDGVAQEGASGSQYGGSQYGGGQYGSSSSNSNTNNFANVAAMAGLKPADQMGGKEEEISFDDDDIPF